MTRQLLEYWLVDQDKDKACQYFMTLMPQERILVLGALREVIAFSDNADFRQAAKDIPEYIKSKL